jgi:FHS family L-fucose permease-like MFS transporter
VSSERHPRTSFAFAAVTSLFFAWGFITSNNDPLIVALRAAFSLDYLEALLIQIIFFLAYGLLSLPAAWLSGRIGPIDTILVALGLMAGGCLAVVISTDSGTFWPILAALFVLAAGFTTLQTAANPLAAELGPPERSHFRLSFAQAFNSLGVACSSAASPPIRRRAGPRSDHRRWRSSPGRRRRSDEGSRRGFRRG